MPIKIKAEKFKSLIEKNGVTEIAKYENLAGLYSNNEILEAFDYLEGIGWDKIKLVREIDNAILNAPEVQQQKKVKRITFDTALNRRISNAFDLSEIRRLGIKHMSPEEALSLVEARENERRIR
jgi:hypothetical protein